MVIRTGRIIALFKRNRGKFRTKGGSSRNLLPLWGNTAGICNIPHPCQCQVCLVALFKTHQLQLLPPQQSRHTLANNCPRKLCSLGNKKNSCKLPWLENSPSAHSPSAKLCGLLVILHKPISFPGFWILSYFKVWGVRAQQQFVSLFNLGAIWFLVP